MQQLCADRGCSLVPEAMDDREGWRQRFREIHVDGVTWWWWCIHIERLESIIDLETTFKSGIFFGWLNKSFQIFFSEQPVNRIKELIFKSDRESVENDSHSSSSEYYKNDECMKAAITFQHTRTHTHTHIYIYIYIHMYISGVCVSVSKIYVLLSIFPTLSLYIYICVCVCVCVHVEREREREREREIWMCLYESVCKRLWPFPTSLSLYIYIYIYIYIYHNVTLLARIFSTLSLAPFDSINHRFQHVL